jgi:hypothetical protein
VVPSVDGDVSVSERDEHLVVQISESSITIAHYDRADWHSRFSFDDNSDLHDAVHAATMLNLHLVLLDADIVVAIVHVNASILGS